jgi:hypothetical protein
LSVKSRALRAIEKKIGMGCATQVADILRRAEAA